ncbi:MAG: helix-turn-helix domain-containing protein [Oscillospiraceae bacterium]|jgi:transcriptional regulator with XRE-family HTH domain|nr:helix-turn-helix domain-containing protein [Oscillospiraceae bacterium]
MSKTSSSAFDAEIYYAPFATHFRDFMDSHPNTGEKTTQKAIADYLGVRPQTVSCYATGQSLPNCEQLLKIADYFGVTCDFMMTGRRVENKPVRETLGLSENTVQALKLVKEGYWEDCPAMLPVLDTLLGEKDFYTAIEKAVDVFANKHEYGDRYQQFLEWECKEFLDSFLLEFFRKNLLSIYAKNKEGELNGDDS